MLFLNLHGGGVDVAAIFWGRLSIRREVETNDQRGMCGITSPWVAFHVSCSSVVPIFGIRGSLF
jgi:hypothetical protein